MNEEEKNENEGKIKIVCISDTHNNHRKIKLPEGDILIHAGDYTQNGNENEAIDFNDWLGEQTQFQYRIVVSGNHENSVQWKKPIEKTISNAIYLIQKEITLNVNLSSSSLFSSLPNEIKQIKIYGTKFFWPTNEPNHAHCQISKNNIDILVTHGPLKGLVDDDYGCPTLLSYIINNMNPPPKLIISGHIHGAHGVANGSIVCDDLKESLFVNASICKGRTTVGFVPIVVYL